MVEQLFEALTAIVISIGVCLLYFYGSNFLLKKAMHSGAGLRNPKKDIIQPWLFIAPALIFLIIYLVYPAFKTLYLSFHDKDGIDFVGLFNYRWAFTNSEFLLSIMNNIICLIVVPSFSTVLKVFDIVLTMTNGQWDTEVLGNLMFDWMFRGGGDSGRGAMIAVMIMVGVLPIMIWNIYNGRKN